MPCPATIPSTPHLESDHAYLAEMPPLRNVPGAEAGKTVNGSACGGAIILPIRARPVVAAVVAKAKPIAAAVEFIPSEGEHRTASFCTEVQELFANEAGGFSKLQS